MSGAFFMLYNILNNQCNSPAGIKADYTNEIAILKLFLEYGANFEAPCDNLFFTGSISDYIQDNAHRFNKGILNLLHYKKYDLQNYNHYFLAKDFYSKIKSSARNNASLSSQAFGLIQKHDEYVFLREEIMRDIISYVQTSSLPLYIKTKMKESISDLKNVIEKINQDLTRSDISVFNKNKLE